MPRVSGSSWRSGIHRWFLSPGCRTSVPCSIGRCRQQVRMGSTSITEPAASMPPVTAGRLWRSAPRRASGLVHVAIEEPGQIQTIDPRTGTTACFTTAAGAPTTALVPPDHLYVFSPHHRGVLDLVEAPGAPHSGIYKTE